MTNGYQATVGVKPDVPTTGSGRRSANRGRAAKWLYQRMSKSTGRAGRWFMMITKAIALTEREDEIDGIEHALRAAGNMWFRDDLLLKLERLFVLARGGVAAEREQSRVPEAGGDSESAADAKA